MPPLGVSGTTKNDELSVTVDDNDDEEEEDREGDDDDARGESVAARTAANAASLSANSSSLSLNLEIRAVTSSPLLTASSVKRRHSAYTPSSSCVSSLHLFSYKDTDSLALAVSSSACVSAMRSSDKLAAANAE